MAWGGESGLLPHPGLQMLEQRAGQALAWAGCWLQPVTAALPILTARPHLRQAEMSCCHLVTGDYRDA